MVVQRRVVDAVDALAAELRLANRIEVLKAGTSLLDDVETSTIKSESTARRQERLNVLRGQIRADLGLERS